MVCDIGLCCNFLGMVQPAREASRLLGIVIEKSGIDTCMGTPPLMIQKQGRLGVGDDEWWCDVATRGEWSIQVYQIYVRSTPHPVTVATRIITFLVGNPYKPSFATVTGWGVDPKYTYAWYNVNPGIPKSLEPLNHDGNSRLQYDLHWWCIETCWQLDTSLHFEGFRFIAHWKGAVPQFIPMMDLCVVYLPANLP